MSGALLALAIPSAASAVQLNYELGFGVEHDDNVNLSENNPESDNILIPTLGFSVSQLGSKSRPMRRAPSSTATISAIPSATTFAAISPAASTGP